MHKKDTRIMEALCNELGEIVDIDEAVQAYIKQPQKLTFSCSDPECAKLVVGVAYGLKQPGCSPHFRRHVKHPHAETCVWGKYEKTLRQLLEQKELYQERGGNIFKAFEKVSPYDVFDAFHPHRDIPGTNEVMQKERVTKSTNITNYILNMRKSTSSFERLVNLFEIMSDADKKTGKITILEQKLAYAQIFQPVACLREFHFYPNIYYSEARIYKNSGGYTAFLGKVNQYVGEKKIQATLFIPNRLENANKAVFEQLKTAHMGKQSLNCYIFGLNRHYLCTTPLSNTENCCQEPYEYIRGKKVSDDPCVTFCARNLVDICFTDLKNQIKENH